ncbi:MAG: hypothetical protein WD063_03140 [Pirellulales bacterium]
MRKFLRINGLSMSLATLLLFQATSVRAADGLFRSSLNSMVSGGDRSGMAQGMNQAAKQYPSSPAGGAVAGLPQPQRNGRFVAGPIANATATKIIAAPNGHYAIQRSNHSTKSTIAMQPRLVGRTPFGPQVAIPAAQQMPPVQRYRMKTKHETVKNTLNNG